MASDLSDSGRLALVGIVAPSTRQWNYNQAKALSGLDFQPHEVVRDIKPPIALRVKCVEPVWTNDDQFDRALTQRVLNELCEMGAGWDVVHILEDILAPKLCDQSIVYPSFWTGPYVKVARGEEANRERGRDGIRTQTAQP